MKRIGIICLIFFVTGCATGGKKEASVPPGTTPSIDFLAVQHDLGMDVSPDWVGYREKSFDACRMASDLPNVSDCGHAYFIQVGVQLSCRPTEEAQNKILYPSDLTPIAKRELRWQLGKASGRIRTDSGGYGLILAITSSSLKKEMLRISTGVDYLLMRAGQATNIVTPVSWCQ